MHAKPLLAVALVTGCVLSVAAHADDTSKIYHWTDGKGEQHFGDVVPPGVVSSSMSVKSDQGTRPAANSGKINLQQCDSLKKNLETYQSANKIVETDALGNRRTLSAEERKKLVAITREKEQAACAGKEQAE